ncbi:MAG: decaprenyl-phosphate phosphoribosyltransferase, partial [Solirubrobacteraceae bacterium]
MASATEREATGIGAPGRAASLGPVARTSALVRACRPRQWAKNVLVAAAPAAAGVLGRPEVAAKVALTFVAFCMLASCTYLLNDVHDRAEDRCHARKRLRPVASG